LIEPWGGQCSAGKFTPARENLLAHCNLGYARGACAHFPADEKTDAVRFDVVRGDDSLVHFVVEGAHRPIAHGIAALSEDLLIRRQAEAFRESYRKLQQSS